MVLAWRSEIDSLHSSTTLQLNDILALDSHDVVEPGMIDSTDGAGLWRVEVGTYGPFNLVDLHTKTLGDAAILDSPDELEEM